MADDTETAPVTVPTSLVCCSEYKAKYKDYSTIDGWYSKMGQDAVERAANSRENGHGQVLDNCITAAVTPYPPARQPHFSVEKLREIRDSQWKYRWEPPMTF